MLFSLTSIVSLLALSVSATPHSSGSSDLTKRENNAVKYLGSQSATLSGGTRFGDLVFVSGQVPLINGTVVPGGSGSNPRRGRNRLVQGAQSDSSSPRYVVDDLDKAD